MNNVPEIHYLWIGIPTHDNVMALPGHDIAGPISMFKELQKDNYKEKNLIKFWRLEKYKDYYQAEFNKYHVAIQVCTIERLLSEKKMRKQKH
ncbi:MAG: hypothetical protein QM652_07665 [Legionella sp.]|uniref:hypothetical protein n=1 Tax=Legionella sp. TaxID=459 RepID=UPI0039E27509